MKEIHSSLRRLESRLLLAENKLALFYPRLSAAEATAEASESRSFRALDLALEASKGMNVIEEELPRLQEGIIEALASISAIESHVHVPEPRDVLGEELARELSGQQPLVSVSN